MNAEATDWKPQRRTRAKAATALMAEGEGEGIPVPIAAEDAADWNPPPPKRTPRVKAAAAVEVLAEAPPADLTPPEAPMTPPSALPVCLLDHALATDDTRALGSDNHRPPWATVAADPTTAAEIPTFYCDTCWAPLAEDATECPDCCRSRAEMQAESERRAEADRAWKPERALDYVEPEINEPLAPLEEAAVDLPPARVMKAAPVRMKRGPGLTVLTGPLKALAYVAGTVLLIGSVTLGCFWYSIASFK